MLQFAVFLLVIALIAALLGFGGLAGSFVGLAKIVFFVFLVLAVLSFFGGSVFRRAACLAVMGSVLGAILTVTLEGE